MTEHPFTAYQLFNLKLETLEQRILDHYQETQDSTTTVKLILALRVRYQLGSKEFALVLKDLVRHLFLQTKATRTMKHFFYHFKDYFEASELSRLKLRLFPVKQVVEKVKTLLGSQIAKFRPTEEAIP